ncbi:hypothetical protein QR685DRAFT_509670 [Neurospora intermedia]|uniref:Uncharacterized protein n=1 Tax=Neurospora intermedia TaxID=5142 RepID=A0ABR3DNZ5_NEUIN
MVFAASKSILQEDGYHRLAQPSAGREDAGARGFQRTGQGKWGNRPNRTEPTTTLLYAEVTVSISQQLINEWPATG